MTAREQIITLLSRLPLADGRAGLLEGWADHVMLALAFGEVDEHPWGRVAGTIAARDELLELATKAKALGEQIQSLKGDTRAALKQAGLTAGESWTPDSMMDDLRRILRLAGDADETLAGQPIRKGNAKHKPAKIRAQRTAWALGNAYFALTGRPPTISNSFSAQGPFLDLVRDGFVALGLDAKPEGYAKEAGRLFRQRQARRNDCGSSLPVSLE